MTNEVVACAPKDDIRDAERAMAKNHKSRIMCVDEDGLLLLAILRLGSGPAGRV
jgi:CBS domain-containing protein